MNLKWTNWLLALSLATIVSVLSTTQARAIPLTFDGTGGNTFTGTLSGGGTVTLSATANILLRRSGGLVTRVQGTLTVPNSVRTATLQTLNINQPVTGTGTATLRAAQPSLQNASLTGVTANLVQTPQAVVSNPVNANGSVVMTAFIGGVIPITINGTLDLEVTLAANLNTMTYTQGGGNLFFGNGTVTPGPTPNDFSTTYTNNIGGSFGTLDVALTGDVFALATLDLAGSQTTLDLSQLDAFNESLNTPIGLPIGGGGIQDMEPGVFSGPGRDIRVYHSFGTGTGNPIPFPLDLPATVIPIEFTDQVDLGDTLGLMNANASGSVTAALTAQVEADGLTINLEGTTSNSPGLLDVLQVPVLDATDTVNFPPTLVGVQTTTETVTLSNVGTDLSLTNITAGGSSSSQFSPGGTQVFNNVAVGSPVTRDYNFSPTSIGPHSTVVNHTATNLAGADSTTLNGEGVAPVQSADSTVAESSPGIPYTRIGTTSTGTIDVTNTGNGNLSGLGAISNLNGDVQPGNEVGSGGGAFDWSPGGNFSLGDGASQSFAFSYSPTSHGFESTAAGVTIDFQNGSSDGTNSAQSIQVQLSGQGVGPVYDSVPPPGSTLDFGAVPIGLNGQLTLDISNISTDPNGGDTTLTDLTILSAVISGPDGAEFSIPIDPAGTVLGQGDLLSLLIDFDPTFPSGQRFATLTILTDQGAAFGQAGASFIYDLTGLAAPEPASLAVFGLATIGGVGFFRWRRRRQTVA